MKFIKHLFFITIIFSCKTSVDSNPNFIFIYTDDQRFDAFGIMSNGNVITPNLDELAKSGAILTNVYNMGGYHGAVCVASRSMMISGKSIWKAKQEVDSNNKDENNAILNSWPVILKNNGYRTYMTGKWHINLPVNKLFDVVKNPKPGMPKDKGSEYNKQLKLWENESNQLEDLSDYMPIGYNRPINENDNSWRPDDSIFGGFWEGGKHWSEVIKDDAIEFINDSQNFQNPFFMYLAFNAPHDPRQAPKKFLNLYPIEKISIPVNYSPAHPYMYEIGNGPGLRDEALAPYPRSKYSVKKHIQEYYAIITHLDEQVGKIISHLENKKLLENTYIIFTSDHGLSVGQHGLLGKQSLYDHSIRVPMIISGPKIKANSSFNSDVYLQDIVPTTLDLANISIPDEMDFRSFYKLLINGKKEKIHNAIYGTYGCCGNEYFDYQRMIRKDDYKLIFFPQNKRMEFYNLGLDPYETTNLIDKNKNNKLIALMYEELIKIQHDLGDTLNLRRIFNKKIYK